MCYSISIIHILSYTIFDCSVKYWIKFYADVNSLTSSIISFSIVIINKRIEYYSYNTSLSKTLFNTKNKKKHFMRQFFKWILKSVKIFVLIKRFFSVHLLEELCCRFQSKNIIRAKYLAFYLFSLWLFLKVLF